MLADLRIQRTHRAVVERERRFLPWVAVSCQVVQCGAERVNISPCVGNAAVLFRRRIAFGADHRSPLAALDRPRNPKIDQCDLSGRAQHDIAWL